MKNWTIKEAVNVINAGTDEASIKELAKHFPMFFMAVAKNDLTTLANAMGDKFTVRRLDFGAAAAGDDDDDEDTAAEGEAATQAEQTAPDDLSSMSTKQLMKLCDDRGIKVPHYGKNKQFYLDALNGAGATKAAETTKDDEAEEAAANPYEGKTAMELFKECKKRGIKAEPKQKAKVYAMMLMKDDAAAAAEESGDDDDGWGEDDTEETKPAKQTKPGKKDAKEKNTKAKKAEPAPDPEEDGDDDWEI